MFTCTHSFIPRGQLIIVYSPSGTFLDRAMKPETLEEPTWKRYVESNWGLGSILNPGAMFSKSFAHCSLFLIKLNVLRQQHELTWRPNSMVLVVENHVFISFLLGQSSCIPFPSCVMCCFFFHAALEEWILRIQRRRGSKFLRLWGSKQETSNEESLTTDCWRSKMLDFFFSFHGCWSFCEKLGIGLWRPPKKRKRTKTKPISSAPTWTTEWRTERLMSSSWSTRVNTQTFRKTILTTKDTSTGRPV